MKIFEFIDYRDFLRNHLASLPKKGRGEISRWANHLRVNATLISQILNGKKELTLEQAGTLAEYFALTSLEKDYFIHLVLKERAGTHQMKKYFQEKINEIRSRSIEVSERVKKDRNLTDIDKAQFYSSWLYSGIRLYCSIGEGKTIDQIVERFQIERKKITEIMQFLVNTKLVVNDGPFFKMGPQTTHLESTSPLIQKHHSNWRLKSLQTSDSLTAHELMYTSPISLSKKDFDIIREDLVQMIQKLLERVKASPAEEVACINIDFFWLR
jgi:uncharacterized protein (TIGR02147 family)